LVPKKDKIKDINEYYLHKQTYKLQICNKYVLTWFENLECLESVDSCEFCILSERLYKANNNSKIIKVPILILANLLRFSWIILNLKDIFDVRKWIPKIKKYD